MSRSVTRASHCRAGKCSERLTESLLRSIWRQPTTCPQYGTCSTAGVCGSADERQRQLLTISSCLQMAMQVEKVLVKLQKACGERQNRTR